MNLAGLFEPTLPVILAASFAFNVNHATALKSSHADLKF
jgi:hypothetical protein